ARRARRRLHTSTAWRRGFRPWDGGLGSGYPALDRAQRQALSVVMTMRTSIVVGFVAAAGLTLSLGARTSPRTTPLPAPALDARLGLARRDQTIVFAGGCFWGVDAVFSRVKGVKAVTSGYAGGTAKSPSYEEVSSGETGHAESVRVVFDSSEVSLGTL